MKTINFDEKKKTVIIDGKEFDIVERKPVDPTLEECVFENTWVINFNGQQVQITSGHAYNRYPTESEAEKVMLYGLLRSVAWKLNYGIDLSNPKQYWVLYYNKDKCAFETVNFSSDLGWSDVLFATRALAEQAIRIFAASKYDLKKLYQ